MTDPFLSIQGHKIVCHVNKRIHDNHIDVCKARKPSLQLARDEQCIHVTTAEESLLLSCERLLHLTNVHI